MNETTSAAAISSAAPRSYTLWQLIAYFLRLGALGFGGPVALAGYMDRDLVERRQWFTEADYKEGLALAQLAPGPLAAQLAIYLGFVHYSFLGATLVGLAFVLPSFLMVIGLGWAYTHFGGLGWMQAVFYGVSSAVIGIIAVSTWKLSTKNIGKDKLQCAIFAVAAAVTIITQSEELWLFLGAGILVWLLRAPPKFIKPSSTLHSSAIPLLALLGLSNVDWTRLWQITKYFFYAGSFVFGSGLAIVPFLYSGVVKEYGWLTDHQFLDAVAVAMITPGPVVVTTGFIGFLVADFWGAVAAALATFLPCYLFTVLPAPYFKKYGKKPGIVAFVDGVTAAAIGSLAGAVVVIGVRSIKDVPTALLALGTAALLWKFKKLPEPIVVAAAALIGLVVYPLVTRS
ncbi:chromate transporter, chromate ion transporter family protein [Paraburkholderia xenovorans LB400]|jgi:chromate transporter|uniref:Chromate transporter, chromate ion transporter (CHR) family n=2 Tax=Burkholderiales TaxID=80840 RepID=C5T7I7_ACIDE|nr:MULTISPECIES: chromate transporter [Burkholderiales]KEH10411.1 chromate transporter [Delftia sp. 670]ABE37066.1 Chromate transporter [Paraburkholderia xenovorans LB400]AIP34965.1 chromate transporter, chromate ion transporter family protein [Paraburkholderia xenovorans LB400]EER59567.1 chromate transporter, chromate ion transporter (CHR) family [Acidovorax delafieldii 2AN]BDE74788.1 chromate resistance transporter [Delftia lacustris]